MVLLIFKNSRCLLLKSSCRCHVEETVYFMVGVALVLLQVGRGGGRGEGSLFVQDDWRSGGLSFGRLVFVGLDMVVVRVVLTLSYGVQVVSLLHDSHHLRLPIPLLPTSLHLRHSLLHMTPSSPPLMSRLHILTHHRHLLLFLIPLF